jgi:hypothetical protein
VDIEGHAHFFAVDLDQLLREIIVIEQTKPATLRGTLHFRHERFPKFDVGQILGFITFELKNGPAVRCWRQMLTVSPGSSLCSWVLL